MSRSFAVFASVITLVFATPAFAHHPGGAGNAGAGGPIITIPAETLEAGHFATAVWYEYIRFGALADAALINAASKHIHAHSIATVESAVAAFAYGITDDLQVALRVPNVRRTDIREGHHAHVAGLALNSVDARGDSTGVGDATLLAQWRFHNDLIASQQAALLIGVKMPTGTTNTRDQLGQLFETEFQPGSGSWDVLAGLAATQRFGKFSIDANVLYVFAGTGAQDTNLGDRFLYNAAVSFRLIGSSADPRSALAHAGHVHKTPARKAPAAQAVETATLSVDATLELNGESHAKEQTAGVKDNNSGGNTVFLSPGIRAAYGKGSGFVSVGIPVVNDQNGLQSKPEYRVLSGLALAF
jgi:hypothetical protein